MRWSKYTESRTTQLAWVARVPNHWQFKRLKYLATLNPTKEEVADLPRDTEVSFLPMEAIGDDGSIDLDRTRLLDSVQTGYTYIRDGDIVTAKITPCFENGKGAVIDRLMNGIGFGSTELTVVRPSGDIDRSYIYWLLHSKPVRDAGTAQMYGAGGQKRVPEAFWSNLALPVPELAEQQKIAKFLSQATAKTDKLIRKQEDLIGSLEHRRRAIIATFITQGLNGNSPIKDSGNPWIGKVPSHWTITKLKYATQLIVDCPHETPTYSAEGEYPVIRTADLKMGALDLSEVYRVAEPEFQKRIRRAELRPNDILYSREGERWGFAALVPESPRICLGQRMMQFRAAEHFHPEFLMWSLNARSTYDQGKVDITGATSPHVNVETIRNYVLTEPPVDEQREIATHIQVIAGRIDALIAKARHVIDLMREHRSALIAAAITGKIDVREATG